MTNKFLTIISGFLATGLAVSFYVMTRQYNTIRSYAEQVSQLEKDNAKLSTQVAYHKNALEFAAPSDSGDMSNVTADELMLLSKVVQIKAGDPCFKQSQQYMTKVILNRVMSPGFPNTVSEVIHQEGQFSVDLDTCDLEMDTVLNVAEVLCGSVEVDLPDYVTYFYADYVEEDWVNTLSVYKTYDGIIYAYDDKVLNTG